MIANGFPPADAWKMTPKQLAGFGFLQYKRHQMEANLSLRITTLGSRGDKEALKEAQKEFDK